VRGVADPARGAAFPQAPQRRALFRGHPDARGVDEDDVETVTDVQFER
jgi:hypothetical protein